jgi:sec-independent protein translocase protein TatA
VVGDILQPTHLIFILVVALLVLGPKRLPEVGRAVGRGLRDFRMAMNGEEREQLAETRVDPAPTPTLTAEDAPAAPASAPAPAAATAPAAPPAPDAAAPEQEAVSAQATEAAQPAEPAEQVR